MPRTKKNNNDLFPEDTHRESYMILEVREKKKRCQDTFEKLREEHQAYLEKYGRTWLRR
jgi:hypothetical protein